MRRLSRVELSTWELEAGQARWRDSPASAEAATVGREKQGKNRSATLCSQKQGKLQPTVWLDWLTCPPAAVISSFSPSAPPRPPTHLDRARSNGCLGTSRGRGIVDAPMHAGQPQLETGNYPPVSHPLAPGFRSGADAPLEAGAVTQCLSSHSMLRRTRCTSTAWKTGSSTPLAATSYPCVL